MSDENAQIGFSTAERRIAACRNDRNEHLDLGGLQLTDVPDSLLDLTWLKQLTLGHNLISDDGARALAALTGLTSLDVFSNQIGDDGARALAALSGLTSLNLFNNQIGPEGARALATLTNLTSLDLSGNRICDDGARALAALTGLTSLGLDHNQIGPDGAQVLTALTGLTALDLSSNRIGPGGAQALAALTGLTSLDLSHNLIRDDGARALTPLTCLTSLELSGNLIRDDGAQALAALTGLTALNLCINEIGDEGTRALAALTGLTALDLSFNRIGPDGAQALAGLTGLTSLNLNDNGIGDDGARALAALTRLTALNLSDNQIGDDGARALAALTGLTSLTLGHNGMINLRPLMSLQKLERINLAGCEIPDACPEFWFLPRLRNASLEGATLGDVPRELLGLDCLGRLRAHFQDLQPGAEEITRVKFMILGNGRIGKTQICHRLRGEDYNPDEDSTHGVRISDADLPPLQPDGQPTTLKIWDFGGQDIYLGTHALFLKTRALFPVVWTPEAEAREEHEHGGLTFRNFPLDYWVQYVAQMAGTESPLVLIQNQVDGPSDRPRRAPVAPDLLDRFAWCREVAYSAKTCNGHPSLVDALQQAVAYLRDSQGPVRIGRGRAEVQRRMEAMQQEAQAAREAGRPDPELGWITRARFAEICEEVGGVSSPDHLLDYLHQIGTVFYRRDFFHDRIIIDQHWALDAIYAVFERGSGVYKYLRDIRRGRFTRYELAAHLWDRLGHSEAEQRLFLSMMQSCGICFRLRGEGTDDELEYVAPDLLPERSRVEKTFTVMWDADAQTAEAAFTYDLLPPGLLRQLMSHFGEQAGLRADYWADGFQFYDAAREARARIEQVYQEGGGKRSWAGRINIRTQRRALGRGDGNGLLAQLVELVDNIQERLGVTTSTFDMPQRGIVDRIIRPGQLQRDERFADAVRRREAIQSGREQGPEESGAGQRDGMDGLSPAYEPRGHAYYVSYAWGGNASEEDRRREAEVDALCEKAERQGIQIIRDKDFMSQGDSITRFMQQIAEGQRVYVVLSQKYLRSPFCMFELHEIHRECRQRGDEFRRRVKVITLPDTDIFSDSERMAHAEYWKTQHEELDAKVRRLGVEVAGLRACHNVELMGRFARRTADILWLVADTLSPTSVDDIEDIAF